MIDKDKLVEGPFGSNACYEQTFQQDGKDVTTWMCFGSGFTTSTLMEKDSVIVKNTLETSPELYKDLMHVDKNNRVWFPSTITLPAKVMVFADGTDKDNWKWAAVKAVELTKEEKKFIEKCNDSKNFVPNPKKTDKSFFDRVKEMFG